MAPPHCAASVLLARASSLAVIFRRGPTKQVLLVRWDRATDTFHAGQWLKGRIFASKCDLSPSGDRLVYFAMAQRGPHRIWRAVSRPPFLTAIRFWPYMGTYGGETLFTDEDHVVMRSDLVHDVVTGARQRVTPEHDLRDGWVLAAGGDPPRVEVRPMSQPERPPTRRIRTSGAWTLERWCLGHGEAAGRFQVLAWRATDGNASIDLGRCDWADWDTNGDLLFTRGGAVFRARRSEDTLGPPVLLVDLAPLTFEERMAPPEALDWNAPLDLDRFARRL